MCAPLPPFSDHVSLLQKKGFILLTKTCYISQIASSGEFHHCPATFIFPLLLQIISIYPKLLQLQVCNLITSHRVFPCLHRGIDNRMWTGRLSSAAQRVLDLVLRKPP